VLVKIGTVLAKDGQMVGETAYRAAYGSGPGSTPLGFGQYGGSSIGFGSNFGGLAGFGNVGTDAVMNHAVNTLGADEAERMKADIKRMLEQDKSLGFGAGLPFSEVLEEEGEGEGSEEIKSSDERPKLAPLNLRGGNRTPEGGRSQVRMNRGSSHSGSGRSGGNLGAGASGRNGRSRSPFQRRSNRSVSGGGVVDEGQCERDNQSSSSSRVERALSEETGRHGLEFSRHHGSPRYPRRAAAAVLLQQQLESVNYDPLASPLRARTLT
jgi:hypothetical protein